MTRCGLRSLSWNWFLAAYVALIAVLLFAAPAHAAIRCRGTNGRFIKCPPPPPPHPCYDVMGSGPSFVVPGSNCPARMCPGYPNPVPWEQPCPAGPIATLTRIAPAP